MNICMNCLLEKEDINIIKIRQLGYGSKFQDFQTELHLCNDCLKESTKENPYLWDMEVREITDYQLEEYVYDDEMIEYIENLPLISQYLVYEVYDEGYDARKHKFTYEDWLKMQDDSVPEEEKIKIYFTYNQPVECF